LSEFERYLKAQKRCNVRQIMCYTQRYAAVLESGDATTLANETKPAVRRHAMEALTIFSKYCGKYSIWKDICAKYQLKWSNSREDNLRYFTNYLHGNDNFDYMLAWLKTALTKLPAQIGNILLYNTLTGLRFSEGVLSIHLVQTDLDHYANKEIGMLENFKYPEFISKRTKKAYLTAYDETILEIARNARVVRSWNVVRSQLKRFGIFSVHAKYCRAIYATYLRRECGIEHEIIDLYQGRAPASVFQAHYLKTNVKDDRERILKAVHQLRKELEEKKNYC
jgi:hypothetical protein